MRGLLFFFSVLMCRRDDSIDMLVAAQVDNGLASPDAYFELVLGLACKYCCSVLRIYLSLTKTISFSSFISSV